MSTFLENRIGVLFCKIDGLLNQIIKCERIKSIFLFQFHSLELLSSESIPYKAQLKVEVVWVLWSQKSPSGLVVQAYDGLDSITNIVVVFWLIPNDHVSFIESDSISWSSLGWRFALCRSSITSSRNQLLQIWLILSHK